MTEVNMGRTGPANLSDRRRAERLAKSRQLLRQGRVAEAERGLRAALARDGADSDAAVMLAQLLAATGRAAEGLAVLQQAVGAGGRPADLHVAAGEILAGQGRWEQALAAFTVALEQDAAVRGGGYGQATSLRMLGRTEQADAAYRAALAGAPDDPLLLEAAGSLAYELGRNREAEALLREAMALAPAEPDAYANLAVLLEAEQRLDEARGVVAEGLRRRPDHPMLQLVDAKLHVRAGALEVAEGRLRRGPPSDTPLPVRRAWLFERGRLLDRLDRAEEAFALLREAKALAAQFDPGAAAARMALLERIGRQQAALPAAASAVPPALPAVEEASPIFLVGFPRSGTTLLHHILASHPGLAVVEEQPLLEAAIDAIPGHPETLASLSPEGARRARTAYWQALREHLPADGRRPVDKLPLNLIHLPTIAALFPDAPIVFALRHPCDVVLSGFMQDFEANAAMAFFYDLADAAMLYDRALGLAERARAVLPLSLLEVRYEDLVVDFDRVVGALLAFLGLPWDPAVRAYAETARRRGQIDTPSYSQVTRPIYTEARYRWRRYRQHLVPHLPLLAPHALRYRYDID